METLPWELIELIICPQKILSRDYIPIGHPVLGLRATCTTLRKLIDKHGDDWFFDITHPLIYHLDDPPIDWIYATFDMTILEKAITLLVKEDDFTRYMSVCKLYPAAKQIHWPCSAISDDDGNGSNFIFAGLQSGRKFTAQDLHHILRVTDKVDLIIDMLYEFGPIEANDEDCRSIMAYMYGIELSGKIWRLIRPSRAVMINFLRVTEPSNSLYMSGLRYFEKKYQKLTSAEADELIEESTDLYFNERVNRLVGRK